MSFNFPLFFFLLDCDEGAQTGRRLMMDVCLCEGVFLKEETNFVLNLFSPD